MNRRKLDVIIRQRINGAGNGVAGGRLERRRVSLVRPFREDFEEQRAQAAPRLESDGGLPELQQLWTWCSSQPKTGRAYGWSTTLMQPSSFFWNVSYSAGASASGA